MIPEWIVQSVWWAAGIGASGAFWYFLSQKSQIGTLWAGFGSVTLALLALALHWHNDMVRRDQESVAMRSGTGAAVAESSNAIAPAIPTEQSSAVEQSPGATVYQAGRDIVVNKALPLVSIQSVVVEARLTCSAKHGATLPPGEVTFMPLGDAHVYLERPAGKMRLDFVSPVRFRQVDGDRITVINKFALAGGSSLQGQPIEALLSFPTLSVPILTVVYGSSLERMLLLEVVVEVNGQQEWYGSFGYDVPFQAGPRFTVSLDDFHKRIRRP